MKNIIIGAGMTGLAAGFKTGFPIYEATDKPGGICRSYYRNGFHFENGGGHWIFGDPGIISHVEDICSLNRYKRDAGIYFNKIFKYPIQTEANKTVNFVPGSMKYWMLEAFGVQLCNLFFNPFNDKYTCGLYEQVIQDDPQKNPKANSEGYNDTFVYPILGLDTLVDLMAKNLTIHYNKEVIRIFPDKKIVMFKNSEMVEYDRLISTMPLMETLKLCGESYAGLAYTSVVVLNIGATPGPAMPKEHWLYVPYCKSGFHRVGFYSNVDSNFAAPGKVGIYVEKSCSSFMNLEAYFKDVISELKEWGFIKDVIMCDVSTIKYAYTWLYTWSHRENYLNLLRSKGIESIGRYGKWKFQGITESISDGLSVIC